MKKRIPLKLATTGFGSCYPDKRALKILFDHYWSPRGWIREENRTCSGEDFAYAKAKGLMFDSIEIGHEAVLNRLLSAVGSTRQRTVADAFVASLSTRRLDLRSALGSYAVFRHLQDHHAIADDGHSCNICGHSDRSDVEDLNVMNFERFKWGGVRHSKPLYAMLDLDLFARSEVLFPTSLDGQIFRELIAIIQALPPGVSASALQGYLGTAVKSNKGERDVIVAILGYCGILRSPDRPGFAERFLPPRKRTQPNHHFIDTPYPACWWRSEYGIDTARLDEYFGHIL